MSNASKLEAQRGCILPPGSESDTKVEAMAPDWKLTILRVAQQTILRPMLACDMTQGYIDGLNNPEVYKFLAPPPPGGWNADNMRDYIVDNWNSDSDILFGIYHGHSLVGTTRLNDIDWSKSRGHLGICIFETSQWGKGLASSTIVRLVDFAAGELKISEIIAGIAPENLASCRAFSNAGFKQTGNKPNGDFLFGWVKPA